MKVLVVPSWYPPTGGRFFKLQAEALAKLGHDVDVLILEEKGLTQKVNTKIDATKSEFVNELRNAYFRIPKLNDLNIKLFIKKYQKLLKNYLKEKKPDLIHIHSAIWAGVVVSEIALEYKIPYIITEHRSLFLEEENILFPQQFSQIKNAFDNASMILAVSDKMKNALEKITQNTIEILPNMVDTDFFNLKNKPKKNQIVFVSVGNLISVKGYEYLLEAYSGLCDDNKFIHLKIIGEGAERNQLIEFAKNLNLDSNAIFCGYKMREELLEEYHSADVFVSSSIKETFGVSMLEAMSCGLPLVATKSGGPQDFINENNGYLAKVENASNLQAKMQLMIENISSFDNEKIRQDVINNYSKEVVVNRLEKVLIKCLQLKKQSK